MRGQGMILFIISVFNNWGIILLITERFVLEVFLQTSIVYWDAVAEWIVIKLQFFLNA